MTRALQILADRVGILPDYIDFDGKTRPTQPDTQIAILAAMGIAAETDALAGQSLQLFEDTAARRPTWQVVTAGDPLPRALVQEGTWNIAFEDGSEVDGNGGADLPELPLGRHLLSADGQQVWLLAAPPALPVPPRSWGVTASLAGLRTARQGGIGSYTDLGRAAEAFGNHGASFLGINPVHAGFPCDETAFSPYSPSHRQWLNTIHIETGSPAADFGDHVDFKQEMGSQQAALVPMVNAIPKTELDAYLAREGEALVRFATHQALSDQHGPYWHMWPKAVRSADTAEVQAFAKAHTNEIRHHAALQYLAETQLADASRRAFEAGMRFGLYLDLAVGAHPLGAETWENPALFAKGASLGAPPDRFTPGGQNWTLAPFVPHALEAEGFASFAAILRRQFRFAKLLRVDHILGFERAFWALDDPNLGGAYVQMPRDALLAVTRIEAARAGATVIGEDLGSIPSGLQEALGRSGLLGCRLVMFEHGDKGGFARPESYDAGTLASFSTHDLPTWEGWRQGRDINARKKLGHMKAAQADKARKNRSAEVAALDAALDERGIHGFLADTASRLVAVQAETLFGVEDQLNLPGTVYEYPNWSARLPVAIEDIEANTSVAATAKTMRDAGR